MANKLKIRKVNTLPGTYEPSTLYAVKTSDVDLMELYMSTSDGLAVKHVITKSEIISIVASAVSGLHEIQVITNITERDALTPTSNIYVLVLDASDDSTVTAGSATYIYNTTNSTWYKVSESESMDYVLNWANIVNKPNSSVIDIDDAVTLKHSHSNKTQLDKISEDVDGEILYNNQPIRTHLESEDW